MLMFGVVILTSFDFDMKQALYITLILIVSSCSNSLQQKVCPNFESIESIYETKSVCEDISFSFGKINWSSFKSHLEMIDATQIPTEIVCSLSSDELVYHCISHPLLFDAYMYDDFLFGLHRVMGAFNGFAEIIKRGNSYASFLSVLEINLPEAHIPSFGSEDELVQYSLRTFMMGLMLCLEEVYSQATPDDKIKTNELAARFREQLEALPGNKEMIVSSLPDVLMTLFN